MISNRGTGALASADRLTGKTPVPRVSDTEEYRIESSSQF